MNRKTKIIVSIVGIVIVTLALLGITYAYYLTRIQGNTNTNSISLTTANLLLKYDDGSGAIVEENIMPGASFTKTFSVTNEGNAKIDNYVVYLEEVINDLSRTEDLTYTLTCDNCSGSNGVYPKLASIIATNSIEVGETHTYTLTVTYENLTNTDQSIDMGSRISGYIQIYNLTDIVEIEGQVTGANEGDYAQLNSEPKISQIVSGKYKFVGVTPGNHTLSIYTKDGVLRGSKPITIRVGETPKIENEIITVNEASKSVGINITSINTTLGVNYGDITQHQLNPYQSGTLAYAIYNNAKGVTDEQMATGIAKLSEPLTIPGQQASLETEATLSWTEDDYTETTGIPSYYFRGNVKNNYVNFAGFKWRIVRINGDGSIRLILGDTLSRVKREGSNVTTGSNTIFNSGVNNAYIGYMYGLSLTNNDDEIVDRCLKLENGSVVDKIIMYTTKQDCESNGGKWTTNSYEATHANLLDSQYKTTIDKFYEDYIENNSYHYEEYLSDSIFCGDKTVSQNKSLTNNTALGFGTNTTYYSIYDRIVTSSNSTPNGNPTFKCAEGANNNYSRYTSKLKLNNNVNNIIVNDDLKHPIATITSDEISFAGAVFSYYGKTDYYLTNNYDGENNFEEREILWFTMTPVSVVVDNPPNYMNYYSFLHEVGMRITLDVLPANQSAGVRPVINIKSNVLLDRGNGTSVEPYTLKLSS